MTGTAIGCLLDGFEVLWQARTGVDQQRVTAREKVGPVAGAREGTGIGGVNRNDQKNTFSRP
jgi:hypothetical protein